MITCWCDYVLKPTSQSKRETTLQTGDQLLELLFAAGGSVSPSRLAAVGSAEWKVHRRTSRAGDLTTCQGNMGENQEFAVCFQDTKATYVLSNVAEVVERILTFVPTKSLLRIAR